MYQYNIVFVSLLVLVVHFFVHFLFFLFLIFDFWFFEKSLSFF